jgi:hypothetical protein
MAPLHPFGLSLSKAFSSLFPARDKENGRVSTSSARTESPAKEPPR